ncbi:hypothetical protein [Kitasatospora sp. NPDC085879]|uniref:hypothetical protein n=1 Tax=Kitasatospora sp. NPDC085879 TaxID=3154769 RepID=UPI003445C8CA
MVNEQDVIRQLLLDAADRAGPLGASPDRVTALVRRRRRVRNCALGLAAGCIAAGAAITVQVADGPSSRVDGPVSTQPIGTPTAPNCVSAPPLPGDRPVDRLGDFRSCQYVGLTLEAARTLAATEHRDLQIISRDGTNFAITFERRASRVCVRVVGDRVTAALIG